MRKTTRFILITGTAGVLLSAVQPMQAQTLGGMGTAMGMSATLSGIGAGVAGNMAMQRARQTGQPGTDFMDDGQPGATGQAAGGANVPNLPAQGQAATATASRPLRQPLPYNRSFSGESILAELLRSSPTVGRPIPTRKNRTSRQRATYARRVAQRTPAQRAENVYEKYQKPPVGWLSYYLKDDRYKVTSKVWNFVTIEDDSGRYPVKYYYQPSSPRMLALLSRSPKNIRRANRVIGFRTWQDAMIAGYRPDPVSQPAPARQIVNLARLTKGPMLARYAEFVYAGQVTPGAFDANYKYVQSLATTIRSDPRARPALSRVVNQAVGATIGANAPPTSIVFPQRTVVRNVRVVVPNHTGGVITNAPGTAGAAAPGAPQGAATGEKRGEEYDTAKNRFGGLAKR